MTDGPATDGDWRAALFRRRFLGVRRDLAPTIAILRAWIPELDARLRDVEVIQIVGTNGKGSTAAMIDHAVRARAPERRPVGLYTSPHLQRVGERIRVDGEALADEAIRAEIEALAEVEARLGIAASFFEVLTVIAIRRFVDRGCRTLILEAGLGARLDATSALPATRVALTRVALDHRDYLGDTLAEIAAEKAAAIRGPIPVFGAAEQAPEVRACFEARAREQGASLRFVEPAPRAPTGLVGRHQRANAGLALALVASLGVEATIEALDGVRWPGRLERLALEPGQTRARAGELWLDVAHNLDGVEALCAALDELGLRPDRIVLGAMADKDGDAMLGALEPRAPIWWTPPSPRGAFALGQGRAVARRFAGPDDPDLHASLRRALAAGEQILVCGSHQLVGPVRAAMLGESSADASLSDPVARTGRTRS